MPELPEVETIRTGLVRLLPHKKILKVESNWAHSFPNSAHDVKQFLIGAEIIKVRRRAKVLLIDLSTKYTLVIHLRMTGQVVYRSKTERFGAGHPSNSLVGELPDSSTRVIFDLSDESKLFFNDQRKFGSVKLVPTSEVMNLPFFLRVGPEPLEKDFTPEVLRDRLRRRANSGIKAALLDQSVIAGVGNIYDDESLWSAKIHPETKIRDLSEKQINSLHDAIIAILKLSIEKGGSSDRNYVDAKGRRGSYLSFAKVFRREGQPCPRCGTTIIKIRVAGRGTHICPHCQKMPTTDRQTLF